jgi:hypothetical protein
MASLPFGLVLGPRSPKPRRQFTGNELYKAHSEEFSMAADGGASIMIRGVEGDEPGTRRK